MSSAISWIEWSMSGDASSARSVTPLRARVASATIRSAILGFFSSRSSTSSVASSETWFPTLANRWLTAARSSSVTSTFLPRTSILIGRPPSIGVGDLMLRPLPCVGKGPRSAPFVRDLLEDPPHRRLRGHLWNLRLLSADQSTGPVEEQRRLTLIQARGIGMAADIRGEARDPRRPQLSLALVGDRVRKGGERHGVDGGADVARRAPWTDVLDHDVAGPVEGGGRVLPTLRLNGLVG